VGGGNTRPEPKPQGDQQDQGPERPGNEKCHGVSFVRILVFEDQSHEGRGTSAPLGATDTDKSRYQSKRFPPITVKGADQASRLSEVILDRRPRGRQEPSGLKDAPAKAT
jgi:hypothetical protein